LKKYLFLITLLVLVVVASGCISNQNQTNQSATKTYSANGMSFQYPGTWNLTDSIKKNATLQIESPDFQITNGNPTKDNLVSISKEIIPQRINLTADNITTSLSNSIKKSGVNATNETVNIAGVTTTKFSFNDTVQNATANVWVIAFEKNNILYILTFASVGEDLKKAKQNFETIINSFNVD
jgi:PsbP-like protein